MKANEGAPSHDGNNKNQLSHPSSSSIQHSTKRLLSFQKSNARLHISSPQKQPIQQIRKLSNNQSPASGSVFRPASYSPMTENGIEETEQIGMCQVVEKVGIDFSNKDEQHRNMLDSGSTSLG